MSGLQDPASIPCWTKSRSDFYALIESFFSFWKYNLAGLESKSKKICIVYVK